MTRGGLEALAYVLQFTTARGTGGHIWSSHQWRTTGGLGSQTPAQNGDLVILGCAPVSPWVIGWLLDGGGGAGPATCNDRYLIENLLDRRRAWWSNVTLHVLEEARNHPRWRWSDDQIAFAERWYKLVRRESVGYATQTQFDGQTAWIGVKSVHRWMKDHDGKRIEAEPVECKTSIVNFRTTRVRDLKLVVLDLDERLKDEERARGVR